MKNKYIVTEKGRRIIFIITICFSLVLFLNKCSYSGNGSMKKLLKIKKVNDDGTIALSDSRTVKLLGIKIDLSQHNNVKEFILKISKKKKIIAVKEEVNAGPEYSGDIDYCYIYIWGMTGMDNSQLHYPLKKGFSGVKDGFFNIKKGIAVNLNALLVKNGVSVVTDSYDFSLKEQFLSIQNEAKKEKIGMWE